MDTARPLRDVFAELSPADLDTGPDSGAGPAEAVLRANGHPDLPGGLVAEAVGSYADTAPLEVAEHLSPYVMAHSSVPLPDLPEVDDHHWLDLVATAPAPADLDLTDPAGVLDDGLPGHHPAGPDIDGPDHDPGDAHDGHDVHDVAFGHGAATHGPFDLSDVDSVVEHHEPAPLDHPVPDVPGPEHHALADHFDDLVGLDDIDDGDGTDDDGPGHHDHHHLDL